CSKVGKNSSTKFDPSSTIHIILGRTNISMKSAQRNFLISRDHVLFGADSRLFNNGDEKGMSIFALLKSKAPNATSADSMKRALEWAKRIYRVGAVLPSNVFPPSEETTGYIIPTFYQYGEKELAVELRRWETTRQRSDGAFCAPDGVPYTFDSAQVMRGFLAGLDDVPAFEEPLRRVCDYVESQIDKDGKVRTFSYDTWRLVDGSYFSDYAHLY